MLSTIDSIARDVFNSLDAADKEYLANRHVKLTALEFLWLETSIMRDIRNQYSLWYENPLTEHWRTVPEDRVIDNEVDRSEGHPDAVSRRILDVLLDIVDTEVLYKAGRPCTLKFDYYPGNRKLAGPTGKGDKPLNAGHECQVIGRTKEGLIEIASVKYPNVRVSTAPKNIKLL